MLLVETNTAFWDGPAAETGTVRSAGFAAFLQQLVVFVQAYTLLNVHNRLAVVAMHAGGCTFLYDSLEAQEEGERDAAYDFSGTAGEIIVRRAQELLPTANLGAAAGLEQNATSLSGAQTATAAPTPPCVLPRPTLRHPPTTPYQALLCDCTCAQQYRSCGRGAVSGAVLRTAGDGGGGRRGAEAPDPLPFWLPRLASTVCCSGALVSAV